MITLNPMTAPILFISSLAVILVDGTTPLDASWFGQFSRLGAEGLLIVAVCALWKKLAEKDKAMLDLVKGFADVMASSKALNEKMDNTLEDIKGATGDIRDAVSRLVTVREQLNTRHGD